MPGVWAGSTRALPDIKTRVVVDSSQLQRAHGNATAFGAKTKVAMKDAKAATLDTERALGQLESRMGGVGGAAGSLSTMFTGGLTPATAGLGLALAAVVVGGKSMLDISEKQEAADRNLRQAVDEHNATLGVQGKVTADTTRQQRALEVATNSARMAQMAHTDAVRKHGPRSEEAVRTALHLRDANIGVANAQDALKAAQETGSAGTRDQAIRYDDLRAKADQLIQTNRSYISDQSEVVEGYGKLVRSGLSVTETQRVMNDAVDLAALKHISLTQAVDVLNAAEHGRMRGLIDLGITTKQLTDENGNLLKGQAAIADAMSEVDGKVAHGRDTLTDYQQHVNQLSNDWQELSTKGGPVILTLLDTIVTSLTKVYDWFDAIGKNDQLWGAISDRLVKMSNWINQYLVQPMQHFQEQMVAGIPEGERYDSAAAAKARGVYSPFNDPTSSQYLFGITGGTQAFGKGGRAGGGPVWPGSVFDIGERGKEQLVMYPDGGGYVIPGDGGAGPAPSASSGAPTINVYVTSSADPADIANEVGWEMRKLRRFA